ncbi:MAG: FliI/YscN family ATPase [Acidobacteria bacterium]|nr:FliI/YscN family ATPase [Acidobacteriota bacterium]
MSSPLADPSISLAPYLARLPRIDPMPVAGRVVRVVGLLVEAIGLEVGVGDVCQVRTSDRRTVPVEVVGFRDGRLLAVPLAETTGVRPNDRVVFRGETPSVPVGDELLGRVIDGFGRPLDGRGEIAACRHAPLYAPHLNPLDREPISLPIGTGVRAIDALLTCGRGQRIGVFGGSGVGKSTLLGMMARGTEADVVVLCLVGERGREVRSFLEHDLGPRGLARSVVVVSTSDDPALARQRAAYAATTIAESFRDAGRHVLLMMDSITRFAMAQREIGLAAGEPPTAKGYPPSVFARLPGLLERAGAVRGRGSITGFYTVLVDGDDHNEPVADAVRAILDGHIVLSRDLAARNHYPAIDVLHSVSRTMPDVTSVEHRVRAGQLREWLATLRDNEDLISVGAYVPGSNARIDTALARREFVGRFLCQPADTSVRLADAVGALMAL